MHFSQFSIVKKLLILLSIGVLVTLIPFVLIMTSIVKPKIQSQSLLDVKYSSEKLKLEIEHTVHDTERLVKSLAALGEQWNQDFDQDKADLHNFLNVVLEDDVIAGGGIWPEPFVYDKDKVLRAFFWTRDKQKNFVFVDDYNKQGRGNYQDEAWYKPLKEQGEAKVVWSEPYIDPHTKVLMITASVGMYDQKRFIGVATIDLSLMGVNRLLLEETSIFKGYVLLLNSKQQLIAYQGLNKIDVDDDLIDNLLLEQKSDTEIYKYSNDSILGEDAKITLLELDNIHWQLVLVLPNSYIYRNIEQVLKNVVLAILLIVILMLSLPYIILQKILVKPIQKLSEELSEIKDQDNERRYLNVEGADELSSLAKSFNLNARMAYRAQDKQLETNIFISKEIERKTAELQAEEEMFEILFEEAADGILLIKNSKFIRCNQTVVKMLRYENAQELLNAHPSELSPEFQADGRGSKEKADEMMRIAILNGSHTFEWIHQRADGEDFPALITLTNIKLKHEDIIHVTWRDITQEASLKVEMEIKNIAYKKLAESLEEEVEERTYELSNALRSKSDFLANMSHEIRTPMNAILGFIDILSKNEKDTARIEQFGMIKESGKTLLSIINDILDFSKMESGKMSIEYAIFETCKPFEQLVDFYQEKAHEKSIELQMNACPEMPSHAMGDVVRIKQVVTNLLSNAIKFTPNFGSIEISIEYLEVEKSFAFVIKDSGVGIKEEALEKIFSPFEQEDVSTTRKFGGTGLGLAISSNLVELMEGEISVESELDVGTSFRVVLPLFKEDIASDALEVVEELDDELEFLGDVLVVEDNKANQMLMKLLLLDRGLMCDIAEDGLIALRMCKIKKYDLILMDENMPNMNGIEATKNLREDNIYKNATTPIIAVTANALNGDKERFLNVGMDEYISKPIDHKELDRVLSLYLERDES